MTPCTSLSADMNIDQGERSRGSWRAPMPGCDGAASDGAGLTVGAGAAVWLAVAGGAGVAG
jgi:hypothetical protein